MDPDQQLRLIELGLMPKEMDILNLLAEAYTQFVALPKYHPWESQEFMTAIHAAQVIVMARPAQKAMNGE